MRANLDHRAEAILSLSFYCFPSLFILKTKIRPKTEKGGTSDLGQGLKLCCFYSADWSMEYLL